MMIDQAQPQTSASVPCCSPGKVMPVSLFSMVLGMSGLGYALLSAAKLWGIPRAFGELQLLLTLLLWCGLVLNYLLRFLRHPSSVMAEFEDAATGCMAALIGISTLVLVPGIAQHSFAGACLVACCGIAWHLGFSAWHGARLWRGARDDKDATPALYLPDVAGNFTSAAALGVLGQTDWAWLFLGAGLFSWLALEPVIKTSIIHRPALAATRRPLMGVQAAPSVECAASMLLIDAHASGPWVVMLLGYGLFQLLQGLRLAPWLKEHGYTSSYWAYTFGMTSALNCCLKLALAGNTAAHAIALPLMAAVTAFIVYLFVRTVTGK